MINQLGSDQCTWSWGHCLLSELRSGDDRRGRHNGLRRPFDNRQSVSQNNHVIFSRVFVNGILETGGVMDKCVQMWTRNYGALGQTARECFGVLCANRKKEEVKRDFGDAGDRRKRGNERKEEKRARKREGLIVGGRGEENPRVLLGDADQESGTRMRKTPCGLDGDKLWLRGKYTLGTLVGCEKQLTVDRESFRNHTIGKIAGQGEENTCKADVRKCLEDGLAMRLPLSEPREIYKDSLATDNRSNIGSEFTFEIDLPGKRYRSTIYRLNLIKLYRRKPELANLVMEISSEGIDSETLYSVKLFMDFGFQGNLRKSQLYFKLPPDRSSYLRMINAKKKERFLPGPGTIVLRQKDINLVTGKPFRIKTCCSSQMLINSLREDTKYLLDLGVNGMGQSNRTLPVVWLGRVNRYPYPRIKCMKYRNLNQVTRAEIYLFC
ncbi:uncharacterized protein TNCV_49861 [Trichonephila clavipes]|nr:uncharacterized protein TNCV_49861 [Trichonephila clavipes]